MLVLEKGRRVSDNGLIGLRHPYFLLADLHPMHINPRQWPQGVKKGVVVYPVIPVGLIETHPVALRRFPPYLHEVTQLALRFTGGKR